MIFVTVGSQLPFDRMVGAVDRWARSAGRSADVFYQVGDGTPPEAGAWVRQLPPDEFDAKCREAEFIVSHAGTGVLMVAESTGTPLVVFPRRFAEPGEIRNDHQMDTCAHLRARGAASVAFTEEELRAFLNRPADIRTPCLETPAAEELHAAVRAFVSGEGLPAATTRLYDGIVCFGGLDYWYHNRGHYDIRLAVELSKILPVLYINSIGMRTPSVSEGGMFWKRVKRKLASFSKGLVRVDKRLSVMSPIALPKLHGTALGRRFLARQVRRAARKVGIERPLLWVACPPAMYAVDRIPFESFVYQRTDRTELFPGAPTETIRALDHAAKARADVTLFCASLLLAEEGPACRSTAFVDHGVDYARFSAAGMAADAPGYEEPEDVRGIPRPRVGYVGSFDAVTFDPELLNALAAARPDVHFVMVGPDSLPPGWRDKPNIHYLGPKPYDDVPPYMAACDVSIMPYLQNSAWIEACNPIKMKEYLAVGRPVVSVPFYELRNYEGLIAVARTVEDWSRALDEALSPSSNTAEAVARRRARVENETWTHKARLVVDTLDALGIHRAERDDET